MEEGRHAALHACAQGEGEEVTKTCQSCRFFIEKGSEGLCRRYPPAQGAPGRLIGLWVPREYWCGEHRGPLGRPKKVLDVGVMGNRRSKKEKKDAETRE